MGGVGRWGCGGGCGVVRAVRHALVAFKYP